MDTFEIPPARWDQYLAKVEELQRGKSLQIEVVSLEAGDQMLATDARLRGIGVANKGGARGTVEIDLGAEPGALDHRVLRPAHLYAVQSASGDLIALDIEDGDQTKTLLTFETPVHVDAAVLDEAADESQP